VSAAADMASDRRAELVRWALCFAVVAAAHGFGVGIWQPIRPIPICFKNRRHKVVHMGMVTL
jgi:hypothetical protein